MRRYADTDEVDLVVVGAGAGGGVLTQRMARAGWRVVCLDAGPFWDPDKDWVSDERGSHTLYWTEPRQIGGTDPVPLGSNNSGRGVGGSMIHYAGYTPRFHPSDFRTFSADGVGADWPIGYHDLKPYYQQIEAELPVAGQDWPWGDPHSYPHHAHPVGGNGDMFLRGALAAGITARVGPVAIPNGRFGNRPHCIYRGFCLQGCKVNAKASPLITHIPDAMAHGAEIRPDSQVTAVTVDDRTGAAPASAYVRDGVEHHQRARVVVVAGYSIETPRLLLLSTSRTHPDGLGNNSDQVGRYLMVQGAPQTAGRFADEIRMYKAPPPEVSSEDFYETDPTKPYRRGWSIQTVSPLPITWAEHVTAQGHWGETAPGIHAGLRALGHPRRAVRIPPPTRQPGHPRRRDRPARPARRAFRLQPMRQRQTADERRAELDGNHPARRRRRGGHHHQPVRPPRRRRPDGHPTTGRRRRRRPPDLRSPQCVHRRRQHPAHPGRGEPGADHHGARRPRRRPHPDPGPRARPPTRRRHHDRHRTTDRAGQHRRSTGSRPRNRNPTAP